MSHVYVVLDLKLGVYTSRLGEWVQRTFPHRLPTPMCPFHVCACLCMCVRGCVFVFIYSETGSFAGTFRHSPVIPCACSTEYYYASVAVALTTAQHVNLNPKPRCAGFIRLKMLIGLKDAL